MKSQNYLELLLLAAICITCSCVNVKSTGLAVGYDRTFIEMTTCVAATAALLEIIKRLRS